MTNLNILYVLKRPLHWFAEEIQSIRGILCSLCKTEQRSEKNSGHERTRKRATEKEEVLKSRIVWLDVVFILCLLPCPLLNYSLWRHWGCSSLSNMNTLRNSERITGSFPYIYRHWPELNWHWQCAEHLFSELYTHTLFIDCNRAEDVIRVINKEKDR